MRTAFRLVVIGGSVLATGLLITRWFLPMLLTGERVWWLFYAIWLFGFSLAAAFAAAAVEGWAEELIDGLEVILSARRNAKSRLGTQATHSPQCVARGTEKASGAGSSEGGASGLMSEPYR